MNLPVDKQIRQKIREKVVAVNEDRELAINEVDALAEITSLSRDEVEKIATEIRVEHNLQKVYKKVLIVGGGLAVGATAIITILLMAIF